MKIDRLIGIIMLLLQQDKVTAPELAKRFEVSRRTISRDIEDICKAGIPVVTMQGHDGGIAIADTYKVNKAFFTQEELQTILSGLKGMDSISKNAYTANMIEKLSTRQNRIVADDVIVIDLASHYYESLSEKIAVMKRAILNRQLVSFQYYYEKGDNLRRIEPYRLLFKWSSWYIFGYCLDRMDYRLFKLNRLWDMQILKEHFAVRNIPDERLQLDAYFMSGHTFHLKAVFHESVRYRLIEEYGTGCCTPYHGGGLLFEWDFVNYAAMREWVLSFGDKVDILEPENLRRDRLQQAKNILDQGT